eukprot:scaffold71790_cov29-Tisochrysis_lutea.AAC.3
MPKVRLIFTLRNPVPRAYSEYLNKVADRTVMRYLTKRINNKMEKELSDNAPPFEALVDDVARTMGSCGSPNRTFSMMDEYTAEMDEAGCYVNPFVGEGRCAESDFCSNRTRHCSSRVKHRHWWHLATEIH